MAKRVFSAATVCFMVLIWAWIMLDFVPARVLQQRAAAEMASKLVRPDVSGVVRFSDMKRAAARFAPNPLLAFTADNRWWMFSAGLLLGVMAGAGTRLLLPEYIKATWNVCSRENKEQHNCFNDKSMVPLALASVALLLCLAGGFLLLHCSAETQRWVSSKIAAGIFIVVGVWIAKSVGSMLYR